MQRLHLGPALLLILLLPANALTQERDPRMGFGLSLTSTSLGEMEAVMMPRIHVPIEIGQSWMLEPSLGFIRIAGDIATERLAGADLGALRMVAQYEASRVYAGPRVGVLRASGSVDLPGATESRRETDLTVAAVLGGEAFVRPSFSLGGEVGIRRVALGDTRVLSTTGSFRVRWYLQ